MIAGSWENPVRFIVTSSSSRGADLEGFYFMPEKMKKNLGSKETDLPHIRYIDP